MVKKRERNSTVKTTSTNNFVFEDEFQQHGTHVKSQEDEQQETYNFMHRHAIAEEKVFVKRTFVDGSTETVSLEERNSCFTSSQGIFHINGDGKISHKILSPARQHQMQIYSDNKKFLLKLREEKMKSGSSRDEAIAFTRRIQETFNPNERYSRQYTKEFDQKEKLLTRVNLDRIFNANSPNNPNTPQIKSFEDIDPTTISDTRTRNQVKKLQNLPISEEQEIEAELADIFSAIFK